MKDKFMMDDHKLHWHLDRVHDFSKDKRIAPLHIDFGITTGCNMACTYCYGVLQGRTNMTEREDMSKETITRFFRDAKEVGVRSIAMIGEGENTMNPAIWDAFDCAREINLDISLATNGLILKKDKIQDILSALKWLRVNISAATPEGYYKIHGVRQFDKAVANIKALVEGRKKFNLDTTIGLQMVVTKDNMDEIIPLAKLGKELGVDYTVIKSCSDTNEKTLDSPSEQYLEIEDIFKEAESYSSDGYIVSIKWQKLKNLGIKNFKVCYGTQFILAISGSGAVYPCGHWFNFRSDEFLMGNINETSFKEIVKSERYWEVQERIQKVDVNQECESNCRPYYISQYLEKLKNPPPHVNFI